MVIFLFIIILFCISVGSIISFYEKRWVFKFLYIWRRRGVEILIAYCRLTYDIPLSEWANRESFYHIV